MSPTFRAGDKVSVEWPGKAVGTGVIKFAYPDLLTIDLGGSLIAGPVEGVTLVSAAPIVEAVVQDDTPAPVIDDAPADVEDDTPAPVVNRASRK